MESLEECVLRVLYEGPCTVRECLLELARYESREGGFKREVGCMLDWLVGRSFAAMESRGPLARYVLTTAGSERLALLAEAAETTRGAA